MDRNQLARLFSQSTVESTKKVLALCGALPTVISKAQAYKTYGRSDVDRWISEGLIKPDKSHDNLSKELLRKDALERIAAGSNRITYLPVAER